MPGFPERGLDGGETASDATFQTLVLLRNIEAIADIGREFFVEGNLRLL